jgi:hypothetical protein
MEGQRLGDLGRAPRDHGACTLIEGLLSLIEPQRALILSTVSELRLETALYCAGFVENQTPTIELSPTLMRRIADMGARLDIDLMLSEL